MDGSPEIGGEELGARQCKLVLMALGGCTSMDVLSMLAKMRENVMGYNVTIKCRTGNRTPYGIYQNKHSLHLKRKFKKKENVEKAINLSMDKYCSVTHILNKTATITHSYEIIN